MNDVVGIAPAMGAIAAWCGATAIARDQCTTNSGWDGSGATADVEHLGGTFSDDSANARIAGKAPRRLGCDDAGLIELASRPGPTL